MNNMIDRPRKFVLLALIVAAMPVAAAQAHWDGWRYATPALPDVVELTQNVYAVPYRLRAFPYVNCLNGCGRGARSAGESIEIVREPPIVIETERVVDDPPRIIERGHVVEDAPAVFFYEDKEYIPTNYEDAYHGMVTLRHALAMSMNVATVKVAEMIGYDKVASLWSGKLGIGAPIKPFPAIALGSFEATPYEMATATTCSRTAV